MCTASVNSFRISTHSAPSLLNPSTYSLLDTLQLCVPFVRIHNTVLGTSLSAIGLHPRYPRHGRCVLCMLPDVWRPSLASILSVSLVFVPDNDISYTSSIEAVSSRAVYQTKRATPNASPLSRHGVRQRGLHTSTLSRPIARIKLQRKQIAADKTTCQIAAATAYFSITLGVSAPRPWPVAR